MANSWRKIYQMHNALQVDFEKQKEFCNYFGFDQCRTRPWVYSMKKFMESNPGYNAGSKFDAPVPDNNWADHPEFFRDSSKDLRVLAGQDYTTPEFHVNKLRSIIGPLGLRAVIYKDKSLSWYYTNNALLTLIMSDETYQYYQDKLEKYGRIAALI